MTAPAVTCGVRHSAPTPADSAEALSSDAERLLAQRAA
jgi:hypothetical protein